MSNFPETRRIPLEYGTDHRTIFNFFNAVYAWMAVGLAVTAAVAWYVSHTPALLQAVYGGGRGMFIVFALGAFAIAWAVQSAAHRINSTIATLLFLLYAAIIGAMISGVFIIYPAKTLVGAFGMTAGTFVVMSIYGFVTRRDLTRIGSILIMCALGLFIASLVNVFVASTALDWFITYAVLIVFVGLIAYKTQQLKAMAYEHRGNAELAARYAIVGSLFLYIAFINIFLSILRIMGGNRR